MFLAGAMVLRRLAEWIIVLSLVAGSYAWWGSPTSPLRVMLTVAGWTLLPWAILVVAERLARGRLRARRVAPRP